LDKVYYRFFDRKKLSFLYKKSLYIVPLLNNNIIDTINKEEEKLCFYINNDKGIKILTKYRLILEEKALAIICSTHEQQACIKALVKSTKVFLKCDLENLIEL
jgi:hypothetical protein